MYRFPLVTHPQPKQPLTTLYVFPHQPRQHYANILSTITGICPMMSY
jgi:hypothetical protein